MALKCALWMVFHLVVGGSAYNILFFHPTPSYSHQQPAMALIETLVKRGHHVYAINTNIVPGLEENRNYTYVDMSSMYDLIADAAAKGVIDIQKQLSKWDIIDMFEFVAMTADAEFLREEFVQFHKRVNDENIKFDVVLVEGHYLTYGCALSRLLNGPTFPSPPLIAFATVVNDLFSEDTIGSIGHRSFVPSVWESFTDKMNIWQKIANWFSSEYIARKLKIIMERATRNFFRETYGDESLVDGCWTNVSLVLLSSNPIYFYPRLVGPNVIQVGPLHIKEPAKLPQNIQNWLDGAEKGVIYFSLGSNMKSMSLPVSVRENFLKFFRELPRGYRVLWKWELDGEIPGQSENILGQKWTPQQSVLAHPKVKVFITQGGLQSFQETVHYGVPTVGIPWFGDQELDVAKMMDAGIGTRIQPAELYSYDKIKSALEAVLYDESYSKNMKKLSAISREFTSQAHDQAAFWVEHVARFGGAPHLRPSTADATLFEYFCLDILAVILVVILAVVYIMKLAVSYLVENLIPFSSSKIKTS